MNKYIFKIVVLLLVLSSLGCAHYSRGPWMGKVIDAETKEPIEGAAVVSIWNEDYAAGIGPGTAVVGVMETQTDTEGNFKIPAKSFFAMRPYGEIYGPHLRIFKPGYKYFEFRDVGFVVGDIRIHDYPKGWKDQFEKPDGQVELIKLKTKKERERNIPGKFIFDIDERKIKNYIHLINIERMELGFEPYPEP